MSIQLFDVQVGRTFRGTNYFDSFGKNNDRTVLDINYVRGTVEFDDDTVGVAEPFPEVTMSDFMAWVVEEVV